MHRYTELIKKQRVLIGLLQHCSFLKTVEETNIIKEEYDLLFKLLDDAEKELRDSGLNPHDFLPLPTYISNDPTEKAHHMERKFKEALNERAKRIGN